MTNQMNKQNNMPVETAARKQGEVTYQAAGQDVTLSFDSVRRFLVRGKAPVSDQEVVEFISICKYNQLNPFLKEAFLIKFNNSPAQMIVSKEALMKRAEANEYYDGFEAGLILQRGKEIIEVEGAFLLKTDILLGGWAKVFRSDRKHPYVAKVQLSEYDKGESIWNAKKSTMIRKTAIVQAMREAFPAQLGAMYTAEENGIQAADFEDVTEKVAAEKEANANRVVIAIDGTDCAEGTVVPPNEEDEHIETQDSAEEAPF